MTVSYPSADAEEAVDQWVGSVGKEAFAREIIIRKFLVCGDIYSQEMDKITSGINVVVQEWLED